MSIIEISDVPFNPDGWGPPSSPTSSSASATPFSPFSRSDKLGRIADWTRNPNANLSNASRTARDSSSLAFDFSLDFENSLIPDDSSFRLVDGKPPPKPKFGPRWRYQNRPQLPQRKDEEAEVKKRKAEEERAKRSKMYHQSHHHRN